MTAALPPVKSAGVIPYAINAKNEINFLLGREAFQPGWRESDKWGCFGGKIESTDACVEHGAARESYEETAGCVFSFAEIRQRLQTADYRLALDAIFRKARTVYFFVHVPFKDYPILFRRTKQFVQYCGGKTDCIEKSQLKWFSYEQLRRELFQLPSRKNFGGGGFTRRPFFRRKFAEIMKFFYENNGVTHLQRPPTGQRPPARKYIYFRINPTESHGDVAKSEAAAGS